MSPEVGIRVGNSTPVSCLVYFISYLCIQYGTFRNLQKTLSELQSYQVRLKNFQTLHEEMLRHVVDSETRQLTALTYDHITYGPLEGNSLDFALFLPRDLVHVMLVFQDYRVTRLHRTAKYILTAISKIS